MSSHVFKVIVVGTQHFYLSNNCSELTFLLFKVVKSHFKPLSHTHRNFSGNIYVVYDKSESSSLTSAPAELKGSETKNMYLEQIWQVVTDFPHIADRCANAKSPTR